MSMHIDESYAREVDTYKEGSKVTKYKEEKSIKYPNIILKATSIKEHIALLLQKMVVSAKYTDEEGYILYVEMNGAMVEVGLLHREKLEVIMSDVFDTFEKEVNFDEQTKVEGELIYALCPPK